MIPPDSLFIFEVEIVLVKPGEDTGIQIDKLSVSYFRNYKLKNRSFWPSKRVNKNPSVKRCLNKRTIFLVNATQTDGNLPWIPEY